MSVAYGGADLADGDALQEVRAGHPTAFGVLYERHFASARRLARSLVSSPADADDIVAEVFAATFAAIRRGRGPETDFAPYLLRSIRRECHRTWRRTSPDRQTSLEEAGIEPASPKGDDYARTDEAQVLQEAFAALPTRMRNVLWQVEVEGLAHDEIARRTNSTPQAVAQLVVRARRTLGERYLHAHLGGDAVTALPADCARTRAALAEFVRGATSPTVRHFVAEHLETCATCREARDHLEVVNERLRGVLVVALAATAVAPRPWVVGLFVKASNWVVGPTVPLTLATGLAVVGVVAPPAVFEPDPPEAEAAALPPVAPAESAPVAGVAPDGAGLRATDAGAADDVEAATFERPATTPAAEDAPQEAPESVDPAVTQVSLPGPVTAVPAPDGLFVDPVTQVVDAVAPDVVVPVTGAVTGIVGPVQDVADPVLGTVTDVLEPVTDIVQPVTETLVEVVEPVTDIVEPVTDAVTETVQPVTDTVVDVVEPVTDAVTEIVQPVTDTVVDVIEPVADTVVDVVQPVTDTVTDIVQPVTDTVVDVVEPVTDVVEPVTDTVADTVQPVTETLVDVIEPVTEVVEPVIGG